MYPAKPRRGVPRSPWRPRHDHARFGEAYSQGYLTTGPDEPLCQGRGRLAMQIRFPPHSHQPAGKISL